MSAFEDSYKSLLQGVSQQIPRERLDGQVSAQENMLSDPVTNLRRRPGAAYAYDLRLPDANYDSILAWDTDLAGVQCHVILDIVSGSLTLLGEDYSTLARLDGGAYLRAESTQSIRVATVGDEFFICNVEQKPSLGPAASGVPSGRRGFFYVKAGAFSRDYSVTVDTGAASQTYVVTTPDGTHTGDATAANPLTLAKALADKINAGGLVQAFTVNQNVYLEGTTPFQVASSSGNSYVVASGKDYVRDAADLPNQLPAGADGYIVRTGALKAPTYFSYSAAQAAWLECGDSTSPLTLLNMPVSVTYNGGTWALLSTPYEGRLAGDDESNAVPQFISRGITGMSSYQGRLVLLAGSVTNLSASAKPRRFFRTTVTALIDSDPIEIGAAAASSAAYEHAIQFGKDLLLFSRKYQALIPGSAVAITPRTANVLVTSTYESDMTSAPVACGRSVMYPAPRSKGFFGLLEMLPSSTVDNQYTSYDSTAHLPKYMPGACRFSVSSSVANMVLFSPTNDRRTLIVHEYTWQGDEKVQQSWHRWSFHYPVAAAYFSGQTIHVVFVNNGTLVGCTIDPRGADTSALGEKYAKLDLCGFANVVDRVVALPEWLTRFDPDAADIVSLAVATGAMAGEPVIGSTRTDTSFPNGRVCFGLKYLSMVSPTPPMRKDYKGVKISSNKMTVLHFMLGTTGSQEYDVQVQDTSAESVDYDDIGTLAYSSHELELGAARVGSDTVAVIPARTNAEYTLLVVSTSGVGELNIVSLEYVARTHDKIKRAWR